MFVVWTYARTLSSADRTLFPGRVWYPNILGLA
jgi:hypothetical protein